MRSPLPPRRPLIEVQQTADRKRLATLQRVSNSEFQHVQLNTIEYLCIRKWPPNCPHKLTKTAEPWLGGGAALGGSELHARVTSAAVRSCHFVLVAAAAAPLLGGRHGGRLLQLRVIALGARNQSSARSPLFINLGYCFVLLTAIREMPPSLHPPIMRVSFNR